MASILLVLEVEGQARRYTSSAAPVTVDGATYAPGLSVDAVQVHALTTTSVTVDEPGEDWPALVLAMGTAPRWPAALYWARMRAASAPYTRVCMGRRGLALWLPMLPAGR